MGHRRPEGYTILEVLMFLAISGFLFATAAVAIGGAQRQARYSQTVQDFEIQIKDVINDVSSGYYPDYDRGRCYETGSGKVQWNNASSEPGTSAECINVGKILMFNLDNVEGEFGAGVVVGLNPGITEDIDLSLSNLNPTLAYKNTGNQINLTTYRPLRFDAQVTKIGSESFPTTNFSSLVFISDFNSGAVVDDNRVNGVLSTNVYGIKGETISANSNFADYRADIEAMNEDDPLNYNYEVNPRDGFYVCLLTSDNRRARIIIGVDGVVTATKTEFDLDAGSICP